MSAFFNEEKKGPVAADCAPPVAARKSPAVVSSPSPKKPVPAAKKTPTSSSSSLPLEGLKIAVSGVFQGSLDRAGLEQLVQQRGGQLVVSVSGRTSYLVAGSTLEDGRPAQEGSKYRTALEKKVPILSEAQFLQLLEGAGGLGASRSSSKSLPNKLSSHNTSNNHNSSSSSSSGEDRSAMLWVDKYLPRGVGDLVGSAEVCRKLMDWLRRWDDVHLRKKTKVPYSKENPGAKVSERPLSCQASLRAGGAALRAPGHRKDLAGRPGESGVGAGPAGAQRL